MSEILKTLKEVCENPKVLDALKTEGLTIDFVALNKMLTPAVSFTTLEQDIDNLNDQLDKLRLTIIFLLRRISREKASNWFPYTIPSIPYQPIGTPVPNLLPQWEYNPNTTPQVICTGGTSDSGVKAVCINQADGCSDPGDVHGA